MIITILYRKDIVSYFYLYILFPLNKNTIKWNEYEVSRRLYKEIIKIKKYYKIFLLFLYLL